MPRNSYSKDMEKDIIKLYNEGYSGRKIIEKLNAPSKQVYSVIKDITPRYKRVTRSANRSGNSYKISFPIDFLEDIDVISSTETEEKQKVELILDRNKRNVVLQKYDESNNL